MRMMMMMMMVVGVVTVIRVHFGTVLIRPILGVGR
jgi:hypothetical protein